METLPGKFGVRKRTNGILVLDEETIADQVGVDGEIDVLETRDWESDAHQTAPVKYSPHRVHVLLITNDAYDGLVSSSEPVVTVDDRVSEGDTIATPSAKMISNFQHASIQGRVAEITGDRITIERES